MRSAVEKVFRVTLWIMSVMMCSMALADWEPETVSFQMVEAKKADPIYMPGYDTIIDHEIDDEDVAILSRLLWSSPLRNETYKRQLCWVVLNRVTDQSGLFPDTINEVVTRQEFTFYDRKAYRSETNDRIAREVINLWMNACEGRYVNRDLPFDYLYIRFAGDGNRILKCSKTIGGEPYDS